MDRTSITAAGVIDTVMVLLIGIGPKLALVPFLEITASLDATAKRRVQPALFASLASGVTLLTRNPRCRCHHGTCEITNRCRGAEEDHGVSLVQRGGTSG
jgi:hypothetical protein